MWLHALVWASLAVCPILGHSPSPPVVDTTQGKVLGKYISLEGSAQPVAVFLGVPFAKPPLGSLRFAPPQPAEPWSFVKNVTSYPPMCYQDAGWEKLISDMFSTAKEILPLKFSEDCLYLNIYSPADLTKGSPLPVLSPLGKDLFHRAISESGVVITTNLGKKNIQATNEVIAVLFGCNDTSSAAMVQCLLQKTESELLEITVGMINYNISLSTVIDGVVLPKAPEEILAEKSFNTVPYIVGFNKQEFGWIIPMMLQNLLPEGKMNEETASLLLRRFHSELNISESMIPAVIEKYLRGVDDPVKKSELILDMFGDIFFGIPAVLMSRSLRDAGVSTYMYEFRYRPSFVSDKRPQTVEGDHGDEIFSVFGAPLLKEGASEEETNLSKMVMKFWANFAQNGNPNGEGLPHWPEYDEKEGYLQIGATTQQAQRLKAEEVAFWTELLAKNPPETDPTEHTEHK